MVIRRIREHVAAQNWFAVAIDLAIVVAGVFLGTQVNNWNESRIDARRGAVYQDRLIRELDYNRRQFVAQLAYYGQVKAHGLAALDVLAGRTRSSDRDFLIDAYQLSQIDTTSAKSYIYDEATAAGLVDRLGNETTQEIASDYYLTITTNDRTVKEIYPYRTTIRQIMPFALQAAIRSACGDRMVLYQRRIVGVSLPRNCRASFDPAQADRASASIRARPGLADEMTRYVASVDEKIGVLSLNLALTEAFQRRMESERRRR